MELQVREETEAEERQELFLERVCSTITYLTEGKG